MAKKATGATGKTTTRKPAAKAAATKKPAAKTAAKSASKKPAAKPRKKAAAVKSGAAQSMGVLDGTMKNVFRSAFLNRP